MKVTPSESDATILYGLIKENKSSKSILLLFKPFFIFQKPFNIV